MLPAMPKINMPSEFTLEGLISRTMLEENIKIDDRECEECVHLPLFP
jgi:hypothetical protein